MRYKDYCAKLAIKTKIAELIDYGDISPAAQTTLRLFLDEQSLATNGFYRLDESIAAEFGYGVNNLRFGICHRALFDRPISVSLQLCDSSKNPLIRASDLLANAIYKKYNTEQKISVANRKLTQISLPTREVRFRS